MPSALCLQPGRNVSCEGGSAPAPRLTSFRFTAEPNATSVYIYDNTWNYLGQLKYRSVRVSDQVVVFTSLNWFPSSPALGYAAYIRQNSIVPGVTYDLEYYLDCTPDIGGYTEGWRYCYTWTQPMTGELSINDTVTPS